ncbi:MAG: phage head-tail adaptor, putative, family [Anaerosolibacter sp.]|jgi:SPP1 family predicted phage head-tail adaptor|uniref:phage head closure protein n=1 Tax=Anaerosolibacter sp. TaxID=1872527 RepID=UPI00260999F3|nr:phage head closure protein [Anaerosolibacter sp.]MDF2546141.1 phage head-tail adaptor, putative, family [Anaerosolibacter sp.]
MNPGRLKHRITIQGVEGTVENECHEDVPNYVPWKTVWASVEPLRGKEYLQVDRVNAEVTHRIVIRYLAGLKPDMRIDFKGRVFDIQSIINVDEENREMQLMCLEKVV